MSNVLMLFKSEALLRVYMHTHDHVLHLLMKLMIVLVQIANKIDSMHLCM